MMLAAASRRVLRPAVASRAFSSNLSSYGMPERRPNEGGTGGRSSNADVKVAVFGASGFLGRYVCCNLGTHGVLAYIGNRGDELELRHIKVMFDLGRTRFSFFSSRDRDSIVDVIGDADIVINMTGNYYDTKKLVSTNSFPYLSYQVNYSMQETNVDFARTIAELCKEMQVDNLIHVSCAAANPDSSSEFSRTKYEGEMAVREIYPWATIIRPTQMFGPEDRFLNWFANAATSMPVVPLVDGGHALTQPVFMADVADTIMRVVDEPDVMEGKTIDCFGPKDYTYRELAEFVYDITQQTPRVVDVPKPWLSTVGGVMQNQPYPMLTKDLVDVWSEDYLPPLGTMEDYEAQIKGPEKVLTMADLGIKATPIEKEAFNYLQRFRKGGHFIHTSGYH